MIGWRFSDKKISWKIVKAGEPIEPGHTHLPAIVYHVTLRTLRRPCGDRSDGDAD